MPTITRAQHEAGVARLNRIFGYAPEAQPTIIEGTHGRRARRKRGRAARAARRANRR